MLPKHIYLLAAARACSLIAIIILIVAADMTIGVYVMRLTNSRNEVLRSMKKTTVQEFATLIRDIAYSDEQSHHLQWSLSIVHPKTNEGDVGYSGGIWCNHSFKHIKDISVSFSFSEARGIYQFKLWRDRNEVRFDFVGKNGEISVEKFKELLIQEFGIEELYRHD